MFDPVEIVTDAWSTYVGAPDDPLLERLRSRHGERQRRYHTLEHVAWVVHNVDELARHEPLGDLGAAIAAALYHDAIYEPESPANEKMSARLATRDLAELGWAGDRTNAVAEMILGTETHREPPDHDTAVLFDADLAILGTQPDTYGRYVDDVRAEYHHVSDEAWRVGRRAVLDQLLDRATIYATKTGQDRWESTARANLANEMAGLR